MYLNGENSREKHLSKCHYAKLERGAPVGKWGGGVLYLPLREFAVLELKSRNFGLQFAAAGVTFAPGQAPGGKDG